MSFEKNRKLAGVMDCVGCTPFGLYCRKCHISLSEKSIPYHLRTKHPDISQGGSLHGFLSEIRKKSLSLERSSATVDAYLRGPIVTGYKIPDSDKIYSKRRNARRHLPPGMLSSVIQVVTCRWTICGRLVPIDTLQTLFPSTRVLPPTSLPSSVPTLGGNVLLSSSLAITTCREETIPKIVDYVPVNEDVLVYARVFHNIISVSDNLPETISKLVRSFEPPLDGEANLARTLEVATVWLDGYYDIHVNRCPANLRAAMVSFDGQVVGDTNMRTTFNCRTDYPTLHASLRHLICFGWRHERDPFNVQKCEILANLRHDNTVHISSGIIPRLLSLLLLENTTSYMQASIVEEYCFAYCFLKRPETSTGFVVRSCAKSASGFATALHILRAGVLSYIAILKSPNIFEISSDLVNRARAGVVVNTISPAIRAFREMAARKAPTKDRLITSEGNIIIRDFMFSKSIWSTLIPRLSKIACNLLEKLFEESCFKSILDVSKPLQVIFVEGTVELRMDLDVDNILDHNRLKIVEKPNLAVFDRLTSAVELMHHGVGLGALRQSENHRLSVHSVRFTNGCIYYFSEPIKRFSCNQRTMPKLVEHKLPPTLTRIVVLYRWLVGQLGICTKLWIPRRAGRGHTMTDTVSELFGFEGRPTALDVRQYVASLCNLLFPAGGEFVLEEDCISSEDYISEQSGHAASTHKQRYGSWMRGSLETKYEHLHRSLGEIIPSNRHSIGKLCSQPIHLKLLHRSLQVLLGDTANFRDNNQKRLVTLATNSIRRHCHVSIPCGGGKSMAWILSTFAFHLQGYATNVSIVIAPYKFLTAYHVMKAESMFENFSPGPTVGTIGTTEISEDVLPDSIRDIHKLPNLLFMTVDAIARLVDCHWETLSSWARSGLLRKIYIDEVHTLPSEYNFRSCYQRLNKLCKLAIPIMTMSGSIPIQLAHSLSKYLGTTSTDTNFDLIDGGDPVGNGFTLKVKQVHGHTAANAANEAMCHVKSYPGTSVHVICSTKLYAETVAKLLSAKGISALIVTGDSSSMEQKSIALAWYQGKVSVLVSTTVALVGNENHRCRHIIVCGLIYHLSNLVQAFGRLRPEQRGVDSFVTVVLRSRGEPTFEKQVTEDVRSQSLLRSASIIDDKSVGFVQNVYSAQTLNDILVDKSQCLLQSISEKFGYHRDVCRRCSNCVDNHPVHLLATRAREVAVPTVDNRRRCKHLLLELTEKCTCGSSNCDGTSCLRRYGMRCFRCGGKHGVKDCSFEIDKCLRGMACSKCWELYSIYPMHKHTDCRLDYRLRAMLLRHIRTNRPLGGLPAFVEEMMTSEDNWFRLVSSLKK